MKAGDVVIIPLPQANGVLKPRPALLLKQMPKYGDWLVCGISTQLNQLVPGFDLMLDEKHEDYKKSKLSKPSIIRLGFLAVLPKAQIQGSIGNISKETLTKLIDNLTHYLKKS